MALAASGDGEPIATFTHDLGGPQTLQAYPPEPAPETRQGEQLANWLYGGLTNARSPKTPYFCAWRDTGPGRFQAAADAGPPHEIFLFCLFSTSAWSPPASLFEQSEQAMNRDQAHVTIGWARRDEGYAMTRIEVEITRLAADRFRSVWFGEEEVAGLAIDRQEIVFPKSPVDPIAFAITASMPRRHNPNVAVTAPTATFTLTGTAPPIPDWVLY